MSEKGEAQYITAVQGESTRTENNLGHGGSIKFGERVARVQSLGSVRLRSERTGEIILVPTPTKDPNDPLVPSLEFEADCRTGLVRSSMRLRFLCVSRSFCATFLLLDRLLPLWRLHRLSFRWKRILI
jgi:hypothetical protein